MVPPVSVLLVRTIKSMPGDKKEIQGEKRVQATAYFCSNIGLVYKVAMRFAPSYDLIGDVVNDVFVNFVENSNRWDYGRDIRPLLTQMTKNIAHTHWYTLKRNSSERLQQISDFLRIKTSPEATLENSERYDEIMRLLKDCRGKLQTAHRQLIDAYYDEGLTLVKIAEEKRLKLGTLQKMMCRIRDNLRLCVEKHTRAEENHV